ncbi:MAG: hypothetical protein AB9915_02205 [Candidatus Dojkabacteria bacterium]
MTSIEANKSLKPVKGGDFQDLVVVEDPDGNIFLSIPKRDLLIPTKNTEIGFKYNVNRYLTIFGIVFKVVTEVRVRNRWQLTASYEKKSIFFYLNQQQTELLEVLCPQFS